MEVVIIILALVFSVWSEINKKKQEENQNIDFSELSSLDDFFKKPSDAAASTASKAAPGKKRGGKKTPVAPEMSAPASRQAKPRKKAEVNYDKLPALPSRNYDKAASRSEVNYDNLPSVSGQINFEDGVSDKTDHEQSADQDASPAAVNFSFERNDLLKSFIMSEVLQRYNIERIYDRIPGIKSDN